MELSGKRIAFLGDSITEGVGTSDLRYVYWQRLGEWTGAQVFGCGISGTRIAPQRTPSENPRFDLYFASRVEEMEPELDVIVIFGGTNDFGHGDAPFGAPEDRDGTTFCGAAHRLFRTLMERYPAVQLVLMTPLHRQDELEPLNNWGRPHKASLEQYVDALRQIAAEYAAPVLDLYRVSGIQPQLPSNRDRFAPDGLHPNDEGNARIAERLLGFLRAL